MVNYFQKIKSLFFRSHAKMDLPRECHVYKCEFTENEIFCGVKTEGVAIKETGENYEVKIGGQVESHKKERVFFEKP